MGKTPGKPPANRGFGVSTHGDPHMVTRRLWLPIGIPTAWNFAQAATVERVRHWRIRRRTNTGLLSFVPPVSRH